MSVSVVVHLRWDESNPGWTATASAMCSDDETKGQTATGHHAGTGLDPLPAIWAALEVCARELDRHPSRMRLTLEMDAMDLGAVILRYPRRY